MQLTILTVTALVIGTDLVAMRDLPESEEKEDDEAPGTPVGAGYCSLSVQARPGSSQRKVSFSQALA